MYQFKEDIPQSEYNEFIKKASLSPIQQSPGWPVLKSNWAHSFCGIYRDGELVGTALILTRRLLPGFTYAYCPRGPVMDFEDSEALRAFKEGALEFCKKRGIYLLTVDPALPVGKTLPDMTTENYIDPFDTEKGKRDFDALTACGFIHKGFGLDMHSATQPRFQAYIPLKNAAGEPLTEAQLKKNYRTKIRKYLGSFQPARGLYYETAEHTPENIKLFKSILSLTEKRQGISLRDEEYFNLFSKAFADDAHFAFEKCDVTKYIENLKARLEKEPENREKLTEQINEAQRVLEERGNNVPLAALLTVYPYNTEGVKVAEYLYAGSDLTVLSSFNATLCGLCRQCLLCIEKDCDLLNLGGLSGHFDDGLFDFKNQFNPIIAEFAGEFDLPVNKAKYALMEKGMPILKKGYSKLRRLIKR